MSPTLKVSITPGLDAAIREAAQRSKISKAEWVRRALERTLAEKTVAGDPLARLDLLKGSTTDIEQALDKIESEREEG